MCVFTRKTLKTFFEIIVKNKLYAHTTMDFYNYIFRITVRDVFIRHLHYEWLF